MFSSRMFAALALVAAVAAYPADPDYIPRPITTLTDADFDDGASWWSFPSLDTFFAPLLNLFPSFSEIGPRIEVDDNKFRVVVNTKDYKKGDLKVKVKNGFIFIQGTHEAKDSDHELFASQFFHTYSLPPNASASDVSAQLYSDGYLIITAPLKGTSEKTKETEIDVPLKEVSEPFKKPATESTGPPEVPASPATPELPVEIDNKTEGTTNLPTTISESEDKKDRTTVYDREEVTEKDNSIPHGSDGSEANELNEVRP